MRARGRDEECPASGDEQLPQPPRVRHMDSQVFAPDPDLRPEAVHAPDENPFDGFCRNPHEKILRIRTGTPEPARR